jgi:hypothetical protein
VARFAPKGIDALEGGFDEQPRQEHETFHEWGDLFEREVGRQENGFPPVAAGTLAFVAGGTMLGALDHFGGGQGASLGHEVVGANGSHRLERIGQIGFLVVEGADGNIETGDTVGDDLAVAIHNGAPGCGHRHFAQVILFGQFGQFRTARNGQVGDAQNEKAKPTMTRSTRHRTRRKKLLFSWRVFCLSPKKSGGGGEPL